MTDSNIERKRSSLIASACFADNLSVISAWSDSNKRQFSIARAARYAISVRKDCSSTLKGLLPRWRDKLIVPTTPLLPIRGTIKTLSIPIPSMNSRKAGSVTTCNCSAGMEGINNGSPDRITLPPSVCE